MNKFSMPELEVLKFAVEDIIAASTGDATTGGGLINGGNGSDGTGGGTGGDTGGDFWWS